MNIVVVTDSRESNRLKVMPMNIPSERTLNKVIQNRANRITGLPKLKI